MDGKININILFTNEETLGDVYNLFKVFLLENIDFHQMGGFLKPGCLMVP